jgi:hypothetical protein
MSNISIIPTYKPPNVFEKIITNVKNNTTSNLQIYLLVMVPILILLIYLLYKYTFTNRSNNVISSLNYKSKLQFNPIKNCNQLDAKYQYKLCDYYISSSFMTPCVGNQHYDYVSLDMIKEVIFAGARYIQIPICEANVLDQAQPVVATAEYGQRVITSLNTLDFALVLKTIRNTAFKLDNKSINYPLFIHLVLNTKNPYTLNYMASNIKEILGDVLVDSSKYMSFPISLEKLCNLVNKIVIFATPEYIGSRLEPLIVPTSSLFEIYNYGELGAISLPTEIIFTDEYNKKLSTKEQEASNKKFSEKYPNLEYIIKNYNSIGTTILNDKEILNNIANFNKVGLSMVKPLNYEDVISKNYNPDEAFFLGCQLITMNFQTNDENMEKYLDVFKDSSFRLKPDSMRFTEQETATIDILDKYNPIVKVNKNIINDFYMKYGNNLITLEPYSLINTYMTQIENTLRFNSGLDQSQSKRTPKPNIRQAFIPRKSRLSTGNNVAIYLESASQSGSFLTYNNNTFILQPLGQNKRDLLVQSFYVETGKVKDNEQGSEKGELISLKLSDDARPLYVAFENKGIKAYADSPQVQSMNNMSFFVNQPKNEIILKIITLYDDGLKTMSGGLIGALEGNITGATEYIVNPSNPNSGLNFNLYGGNQFTLQNKDKKTFVSYDEETGFLYDKYDSSNANSIFNIVKEKGNYIIENKNGDNLILYNKNIIKFVNSNSINTNENLFKLDIQYNLI